MTKVLEEFKMELVMDVALEGVVDKEVNKQVEEFNMELVMDGQCDYAISRVDNLRRKKKGFKFISLENRKRNAKANCMTTEAHFLETMKRIRF